MTKEYGHRAVLREDIHPPPRVRAHTHTLGGWGINEIVTHIKCVNYYGKLTKKLEISTLICLLLHKGLKIHYID